MPPEANPVSLEVCFTTYNIRNYIRQPLEAILAQQYRGRMPQGNSVPLRTIYNNVIDPHVYAESGRVQPVIIRAH